MAGKEGESSQGNLADWRLELQKIDSLFDGHVFGRRLRESTDPYAAASMLGLPVPAYRKPSSIADFIERPESELGPLLDLGISNFYVGLRSTDENLPKFRTQQPLAIEEVVPYIHKHVSQQQYDKYSLRVAEYVVAVCGMVVVVNPSGTVHADMIMGDLGPLATGKSSPEYEARTDRFTKVLRYTEHDPSRTDDLSREEHDRKAQLPSHHPVVTEDLRSAIQRGINKIPKVHESVSGIATRLPGRYELAIVDHGQLVPIYVDAQPDGPNDHPYAFPEEPLY